MKPLPKVKPEVIADAVVATVHTRPAETASSGYVGTLATVGQLTPEPVLNFVRRLVRDDRALHSDTGARRDYAQRLAEAVESPDQGARLA